jgi:hypothetical protein
MSYTKRENCFILRWAKKVRLLELLGGKCKICKNDNIFQLEFHHNKKKESTINSLIQKRWESIKKEGKKCEILCGNCHREHHSSLNSRHELEKRKILNGEICCKRCNYSGKNLSSLDFHHIDPKTKSFNISDVICRNRIVNAKALELELEKCEIVCKNCHVLEVIDHHSFEKFEDEIYRRAKEHQERPKVDNEKIIELYKKGVRQKDIVKEIGCAKSSVSMIIKKHKQQNL